MRSTAGVGGSGTVQSPKAILDAVQTLAAVDLSDLPNAVLLDRVRDLNRLRCAVDAALTDAVGVAHARGAGEHDGCPSTKAWMRSQLHMSHANAGAYVDAATALPDLPSFAAEFTAGRVGLDHVSVMADLRKKTSPQIAGVGDQLLKDYALEGTARELRRLANQVREHFQTENDNDPRPEPERFLNLAQTIDGVWDLRGALTPEGGAMLRTALDAATTRPAPDDDRSVAERRHDALIDLIRLSLDSAKLPHQGGEPVHLGVLVPLDDLRGIQDRLGRTPRQPAREEQRLPDEIAAYLGALDSDFTARPDEPNPATGIGAEIEPLYVPADWMAKYEDPITTAEILAADEGVKDPDETDIELDTEARWPPPAQLLTPGGGTGLPGGDCGLLADLQLALPGPGASVRRMPQPGEGARTDYGGHLSPDAARRLACDGAIHRVVLGPRDVPLGAGQRTRLVTPALRRILVARDGGCRFPGCDRPPAYTQAHHVRYWADGGPTTTQNLILLCGWHHHRVHDHHWTLHYDAGRNIVTAYRPDGTPLTSPPPKPTTRRTANSSPNE